MEWMLDKGRPISPQICEQVCLRITVGEFPAGERLPAVREIALLARVNPNTVQKSVEMLESKGILYSRVGSGWFVSDDSLAAKNMLGELYSEKTREYFSLMNALGMTNKEIKDYVLSWNEDENLN